MVMLITAELRKISRKIENLNKKTYLIYVLLSFQWIITNHGNYWIYGPINLVMILRKKWWIASNNELSTVKEIRFDKIEAMIIIQDGNMGGNYFRYFYWTICSDKRNCVITSEWIFKEELIILINNQVIEKDNVKFIVDDKFKSKYVKLLNKIN